MKNAMKKLLSLALALVLLIGVMPGTAYAKGIDEKEETDTYTILLNVYEIKDNEAKQWKSENHTLNKNSATLSELVAASGYGSYDSVYAMINGSRFSGTAAIAINDGDQVDLFVTPASGSDKDEKPENNKPENNKPENNKPENNKPEDNKPENNKPEDNKPENNKPEDNKPENNKPENNKPENNKPDNSEKVTLRVWHNDGTSNHTDITCRTTDKLLEVINANKELSKLERDGYELIGWAFEMNNDDGDWIAAQHTVADDDDLNVFADWQKSKPSNGDHDNNRPGNDKDHDDRYTVTVNYNYNGAKDKTITVDAGTKMKAVLNRIDEPTRKGYTFAGWTWDAKGRDDVENNDKVTKNCTIYAQWNKKDSDNEVLLKIYVNGNTKSAAKVVDLDAYDNDGKITLAEVTKVVEKYYEAKSSKDDMDVDGLFTSKTWNDGKYNMKNAEKTIKVNEKDDTIIYVMVRDAQKISSSSSTADTTNPKTGDTIFVAVTVMALSASALAAAYVFNKKRAVK